MSMTTAMCGICFDTDPFTSLYRPGCNTACNQNFQVHETCYRTWLDTARKTYFLLKGKCPQCRVENPLKERSWSLLQIGTYLLKHTATPIAIAILTSFLFPLTKRISDPYQRACCQKLLFNVGFAISFARFGFIMEPLLDFLREDYDWSRRI